MDPLKNVSIQFTSHLLETGSFLNGTTPDTYPILSSLLTINIAIFLFLETGSFLVAGVAFLKK
jgi:hypothetical protein